MADALGPALQAFAAGVLSFFAPCSVAMLPAYISYYLRGDEAEPPAAPRARRWLAAPLLLAGLALLGAALWYYGLVTQGLARVSPLPVALVLAGLACALGSARIAMGPQAGKALRLGLLTASGILAVFGLLGVPFVVLLGVLTFQQLALAVLLTGLLIAALGALGLAGRDLSFAVPVRAPQARTPASFLLFGVAYGLVSMGCTFPLFLVGAVGPVARAGNPLAGLLGATSFGAGMASVMLIATLGLATSRGLTRERLRRAVPWVKRASNVVLIAAGLYIVYYVLVTPGFLAA